MTDISTLQKREDSGADRRPIAEAALLNALPQEIAIMEADDRLAEAGIVFNPVFRNRAMERLIRLRVKHSNNDHNDPLENSRIMDALAMCHSTGAPQQVLVKACSASEDKREAIVMACEKREASSPDRYLVTLTRRTFADPDNVQQDRRAEGSAPGVEALREELALLKAENAKLQRAAIFEAGTGFLKRNPFMERAAGEFQRHARHSHELSLIFVKINDHQEGNAASDERILRLAQLCDSVCRQGTDFAGRFNSSEIAIALPETPLSGAVRLASRLRVLAENAGFRRNENGKEALVLAPERVLPTDLGIHQPIERARHAALTG